MSPICRSTVMLVIALAPSFAMSQHLSFRCKFISGQVTKFDSSKPKTEKGGELGDIVFDMVDTKGGTARMIGNAGAETVSAVNGMNSIHMIEMTATGNLNITTVFGVHTLSSNFPVVHSRHITLTGSGPLPSQYLGVCERQ